MNRTLTVVIIVLTLGIALAWWKRNWLLKKVGISKGSDTMNDNQQSDTNNSSGITYRENNNPPLKLGDKGKYVKNLQIILNRLYQSGLDEDGYFGPQTESALDSAGYGKTLELEEVKQLTQMARDAQNQ